jgi:uncharacterized membrane protein
VEAEHPPVEESTGFARIVAFTDGVFAIAITLLVLSIDVPPGLAASELGDYLADSKGEVFAYFLSFAVIGRFWMGHHELYGMLRGADRPLVVLNLTYLSLIVLIPFPTELLGTYGDRSESAALYAFVVGSAALLGLIKALYIVRGGLVRPDALAAARRLPSQMWLPPAVFYASIPVALVSATLGELMWLGLLLDVFRARAPRRGRAAEKPDA